MKGLRSKAPFVDVVTYSPKSLDKCSAGRLPRGNLPAGGLKSQVLLPEVLLPVQDAESREFLAFEVFQAGAATGGNVAKLVVSETEGADGGC